MAMPRENESPLILKLRDATKDLSVDDDKASDMYLLRFLRARDLNLTKAEDMYRKHIEWVRDNDIDKVLTWKPPAFFLDDYPYECCGFDKEGCPVFICPFGVWDVRNVCELDEKTNYVRYVDQIFMKVLKIMEKTSTNNKQPITQFIAIMIPDGLQAFRQFSSLQAIDAVLDTVRRYEANHPERLKAAFVVDAPRAFSLIFSAIKPLLNSHTIGKVTIGSHEKEWQPKLLQLIDESQLPKRLGGTGLSSINFLNHRRGAVDGYLRERNVAAASDVDDGFFRVKVEAGKQFKLEFDVDTPGTSIAWTFKTDDYDIGYSVLHENENVVVPYERVKSQRETQTGATLCNKSGLYTLVFDNKYSKLRSKVLQYKVKLLEAIDTQLIESAIM